MINYIFISLSAVLIDEISYIHLVRVYYELKKWPALSWLDRSVGRALHQYDRKDYGFESCSGLNLFLGSDFKTA